jgi:hypothetical protein
LNTPHSLGPRGPRVGNGDVVPPVGGPRVELCDAVPEPECAGVRILDHEPGGGAAGDRDEEAAVVPPTYDDRSRVGGEVTGVAAEEPVRPVQLDVVGGVDDLQPDTCRRLLLDDVETTVAPGSERVVGPHRPGLG